MTTALCCYCGDTKFGAFCPCGSCGAAASGDQGLDILFSDHRMPVRTLKDFGGIIKRLSAHCEDPEIRFWAFLSYVAEHPSDLMDATPPPELADAVSELLGTVDLPTIKVELKELPEHSGPPNRTMPVPRELFDAYADVYEFRGAADVQLRTRNSDLLRGFLVVVNGTPTIKYCAEKESSPDDVVAIRKAPGCLLGWLFQPRWIERAV
jgi:hypothetical protein